MKFFLPILTFLVILASIFNLSMSLMCHKCVSDQELCTKVGGGRVVDCITVIDDAVACSTTILSTGVFLRECLNNWGLDTCKKASQQQIPQTCEYCTIDACNNGTKRP